MVDDENRQYIEFNRNSIIICWLVKWSRFTVENYWICEYCSRQSVLVLSIPINIFHEINKNEHYYSISNEFS